MTKKLTPTKIEQIKGLLDGWMGPLSWDLLIAGVEGLTGCRYTRQALSGHEDIATTFRVRKNILQGLDEREPRGGVEIRAAKDRIARLEAQNARLEAENAVLMEKFVRWSYNTSLRGLTPEYLDTPLPSVDRERTRPSGIRAVSGGKR